MKQHSIRAHAKINLTLDVVGRREDGYHLVEMVMQSIGLHDIVTVAIETGTQDISIHTSNEQLADDKSNLCYRAAALFLQETGVPNDGIAITVRKQIPMAAGLAGGSTDAAAVLVLLDRLYETQLTQEQLCAMGLKLGADVPFCLLGGTMLAQGIGEKLTRLPDAPNPIIVLCKPPVAVSTPAIYRAIDQYEIEEHPSTEAMVRAMEQCNLQELANELNNVMQPVTAELHPEILEIREIMLDYGAVGALMSGSGPSIFAIFVDPDEAQEAYDKLKEQYPDTFMTDFSKTSLDEIE
ncbi:MAG: 4-(cytidine 5'-diphospho)-2-C-methyl-D-erythritol kinase [Eubacteriales bacterium]|nr:4-(cytidine 5'-diphospho)-2-C-methyl-D-erythritol kinase [Eubacteriales bacterium]